MTEETIKKADALIGKTFNYNRKNIVIERYKEVSGTNLVFFDNQSRIICNIYCTELDDFIENLFEPLEKDLQPYQVAVPVNELAVFEPIKDNESVKRTLLETLEKVKNDKEYIPQAKAVVDIVNSMVNVQRSELDLYKMFSAKRK